jgi:hypothetical protein
VNHLGGGGQQAAKKAAKGLIELANHNLREEAKLPKSHEE